MHRIQGVNVTLITIFLHNQNILFLNQISHRKSQVTKIETNRCHDRITALQIA